GEQRQQRVPEAADIGEYDRLLMLLELRPGELLDELLQCAETARQRYEGVRLHEHQMFPLMHVVDHNQFMSFEQHVLTRAQESRDDARDPAAVADHRPGCLSHQPEASSAIDETDILGGKDAAKVARGLGEGLVPAWA